MPDSSDVLIIGDGPTGISAAILLAKNGLEVDVLGQDQTAMHKAFLYNYLGIEEESGTETMKRAHAQAENFGARFHEEKAVKADADSKVYRVSTEDKNDYQGRYLVLAAGKNTELAEQLEVERDGDVVKADLNGRTSRENVYAGGWLIRGPKIQAAISVGDGAAIALDILSKENGKPFHDFDTQASQTSKTSTGKAR